MSYTPIVIVKAEEFYKNLEFIQSKIVDYHNKVRNIEEHKQSLINKEKERLSNNARELGVYAPEDLKERAERIVKETDDYKKLDAAYPEYWGLATLLSYIRSEEESSEFCGIKIEIFNCEFSSQAYDLIDFCKKYKIPYATSC